MARSVPQCCLGVCLAVRSVGAVLVCGGAVLGCGGAQVRDLTTEKRIVELDPIVFKTDKSSGKPEVYVKDREEMRVVASAALKAKNWNECQKGFDRMMVDFAADVSAYAFAFNAGLCALNGGRPLDAVQRFAKSQLLVKGTRNARDALFMVAESHEAAEQWAQAAAVYRGALENEQVQADIGGKLGLLDELEAAARLGFCLRRAGEPKDADTAFKRVERLYEDNRETSAIAESEWVARAYFERAEIYYELFASIRFKLPVERMQRELEDKSNLFLKAEAVYYRCVRLHIKPWALAAGFRVGALYQRLIEDIDNAEVPNDLDAFTMEVYRDVLWGHTEHLAKRAVTIYEKNIELAQRLGDSGSEWAEKSRDGRRKVEVAIEANQIRRSKLERYKKGEVVDLPGVPTPTAAPLPPAAPTQELPAKAAKPASKKK